jgi:predicted transcriptional regulator
VRDLVLSPELLKSFAGAENYLQFLRAAVNAFEKVHGRGSKALLSRKAGFASRSYLTEVLSGKKGLSRDSLTRLRLALKLTGTAAKLLDCLAAIDFPEIQIRRIGSADLHRQIKELREQLVSNAPEKGRNVAAPHLATPEVFQVYAALGSESDGASLSEVLSRTRLSESTAEWALKLLLQSGAVTEKKGRYFANISKADALRSKDAIALGDMVHKVCANIQKNRRQFVSDDKNLNTYSAFSMRRERIGDLKKSLEAALFAVLDEYQDDKGDCVEQVFVSLFNGPMEKQ